jgi:phenylpropionate dioxygenase-like ring-hydroxylating dioxygenase large terminal subunit
MLSREENEMLTRTGPGTPLGDVIRRYWIPVFLSWELAKVDCPPVKVKVLGENLVGFRDSEGRVGLVEEFCPHRRASLWLGRNEENGLRCVFHGWKYDVKGNCVDMPSEPPASNFKDKIRLKAYPTLELGGIIWAYMGPKEKTAAPPKFQWTELPETHRHVTKTWEECNWLQALEGGLDTTHIGFLHWGLSEKAEGKLPQDDPRGFRLRAQAPEIDVDLTDYGFRYAGIRHLGQQGDYVRAYHYVMPWTQIRPMQAMSARRTKSGTVEWRTNIGGHFWVPMDDENCMVWNWDYSFGEKPLLEEDRGRDSAGPENVYEDQNFRKKRNKDNNWLIDREVQRTKTYTGIYGVNTQDHAVQESMGPIVDRTKEHLGTSDKAVIKCRQLLLQAIETVRAGGDPPGVGPNYYKLRAIEKLIPKDADWRTELLPAMYQEVG